MGGGSGERERDQGVVSCVGIGYGGTDELQVQGRGIGADHIRGAWVWGRAPQVLFALSMQFDERPGAHRAHRCEPGKLRREA